MLILFSTLSGCCVEHCIIIDIDGFLFVDRIDFLRELVDFLLSCVSISIHDLIAGCGF